MHLSRRSVLSCVALLMHACSRVYAIIWTTESLAPCTAPRAVDITYKLSLPSRAYISAFVRVARIHIRLRDILSWRATRGKNALGCIDHIFTPYARKMHAQCNNRIQESYLTSPYEYKFEEILL